MNTQLFLSSGYYQNFVTGLFLSLSEKKKVIKGERVYFYLSGMNSPVSRVEWGKEKRLLKKT